MAEKPTLGDRPTYRQLQDYLGYLRDEQDHPALQDFDLGQKKNILVAKVQEIESLVATDPLPETIELPAPTIQCSVCGGVMTLDDGWFRCGTCPHKTPSKL